MVKVGQKVQFDPSRDIKGFASKDTKGVVVTGTVVYVNEPHQWFTAEYKTASGVKLRTAFKFCDIGKAVTVCGK